MSKHERGPLGDVTYQKTRSFIFNFKVYVKHATSRMGPFWPHVHNLNELGRDPLDDANVKAVGPMVLDKKIFFVFSNIKSLYNDSVCPQII